MQEKIRTITKNQVYATIAMIVFAFVIVVVALVLFMNANRDRIFEQNSQYLEGSTQQTARRVDDFLTNSLNSIRVSATILDTTITDATIDPSFATTLVNSTNFDYFIFATPDGVGYNDSGNVGDVSEREYYKNGMKGETGICSVEDASFDEQNVMIFYSPIHFDNKIIGVLCGVYREETLTEYMTTYFFGEQTTTYLCNDDGSIVARSSVFSVHAENAFDLYAGNNLNGITLEELKHDFNESISVSFTYESSSGLGSAYMMKLPSYDWLLLRTFPESITANMVDNANRAGFLLLCGFGLGALIIIAALLLYSRKERRILINEQREYHNIIDATTELFSGLIVVDFDNYTYSYLKGSCMGGAIPLEGDYSVLRDYWIDTATDSDKEVVEVNSDSDNIKHDLKDGITYKQYEYKTQRDGTERWLQVSNVKLIDATSKGANKILVAVQDVTEPKAQELANHYALEDAFKAAEHASRAKSDFLNSMSHDIRTPMNSIMGMTAIASMHVDDTERVKDCLNNITSASRHLLGLINEVLDMAKIESGKIGLSEEAFDLPESIENLINMIHPQIAAKHQELKVDLLGIEHEHVIGDPTRLQQIFVNIIGNSIKFTPEGGSIGMSIKEIPSRIPEYGCYEFIFSDNGCGMSEEFQRVLFQPFSRANDSRVTKVEGTGLGMAIVKSVVSLMNGTIEVESELGEGTTFIVTVHLKLRDGAQIDLRDLQDIRVLVVDDEEVTCEYACEMLKDIGMRSDYVLSGQESIDKVIECQNAGDPYKAVILDWRMPGMSGIEAAKRIKEVSTHEVPIIILSGYDWSMIEHEAREVGVDAFISKPLFRSRLVQIMKELLSGDTLDQMDDAKKLEACDCTGRTILLVEDNAMAAEIAKEILGMTGSAVEHAENGQIAVDMLMDHHPGYYDIVLMDIQMPVMNGYESAKTIREHGNTDRPDLAEIPIVALTADAFSEDVNHAHSAGMNDHMSKPLEIDSLIRMLGKWLPKK